MNQSSFNCFEVAIHFPKGEKKRRALTADFLASHGFPFQKIVFCETEASDYAAVYPRSAKIVRLLKRKVKILGSGFKFRSRFMVREDWFDKWQHDFQIMPLGNRFTLVPLWHQKKYQSKGSRIPLLMDPKGASGSGQHPSTQVITLLLEPLAGKLKTCLDLGTGTGILSLIAARLGAEKILAVDNDAVAIRAAKYNFKLNKINAQVKRGDVLKHSKFQKYDLVCANLISPVLEKIQNDLFASVRLGGYLAVSGIHIQNLPAFRKRFRDPGFRCLRVLKKRGWSAILFKKITT